MMCELTECKWGRNLEKNVIAIICLFFVVLFFFLSSLFCCFFSCCGFLLKIRLFIGRMQSTGNNTPRQAQKYKMIFSHLPMAMRYGTRLF